MRGTTKLVITLTFTCLVSALVLTYINEITVKPIAQQKQLVELQAIKMVLPPFDNNPVEETKEIFIDNKKITFYLGKMKGAVTGIAFLSRGEGYGGFIKIMLGVTPWGEITGLEILEHSETPGLGARIELPEFKEQFKGKSFKLKNIDTITGATISSQGVIQTVNEGLKIFNCIGPIQ